MAEEQRYYKESQLLSLTGAELEKIYDEILNDLPSRAPIYLPTERVGVVDRILGVQHVRQIYQHDMDAIYRPRLRALREKYQGSKRCFLVGNGPSLNQTDLSVLRDEVTFAVNGFFLKAQDLGWVPTFYVVEDHLVAEDRCSALKRLKGTTKLFPAYLGYVFEPAEDTIFYNHRPRNSYPHGFDFSLNADEITYTGCTVTFSLMQLAAFMGFEEIYLIGVDASYQIPEDMKTEKDYTTSVLDMQSDDPNHFHPDYFGKGYRWHDPQVDKMVEAYAEAKKALEGAGQTIYNATVGGKLDVFDRIEFNSLFDSALPAAQVTLHNIRKEREKFPRVLVMDMTPAGNGTATGELKAALFSAWPKDSFLQIGREGARGLALITKDDSGSFGSMGVTASGASARIDDFSPDLIVYRPVPRVSWLHKFAMTTIERLSAPLITWIVDDWPSDMESRDSSEAAGLLDDLNKLFQKSALRLSICDFMSKAFGARYGVSFTAFANGINPIDWPPLRHHEPGPVLVRYSGGLAENMTLQSILRIAKAVDMLASDGIDIRFEINTQSWWFKANRHLFQVFRNTTLTSVERRAEGYRDWLTEAHINIVAYNHGKETRRYVQYSMANKMPECLVSGAVTFVHGPRGVATVDYLAASKCAVVVEEPSELKVAYALRGLVFDIKRRNMLVRAARKFVIERHDINLIRERFRRKLVDVSQSSDQRCSTSVLTARMSFLAEKEKAKRASCLRTANLLMQQGSYANAIAHYLSLWETNRVRSPIIADCCKFNAQYAARKIDRKMLLNLRNYDQSLDLLVSDATYGELDDR